MRHGEAKLGWSHYHVLDSRVSFRRLQTWMSVEQLNYAQLNWQKLQGLHRFLSLQGVSTGRCLRAINHAQRALRWGIEKGELPQKLTDIYPFHFQRQSWDPHLPEPAREFLSRLEVNLVTASVKLHAYALRVFHTFLREKRLTYKKLRHEHLVDYVKYLNAKQFYQNGRSQLVLRARIYLRWLFEQGIITRSADDLLPSRLVPRRPKLLPRPLEVEFDRRLQTLLKETDDLGYKAILLLRYTGIRGAELRHLSFNCVEGRAPDQLSIRVPPVKLGLGRLVPVDSKIVALIEDIQRRSTENSGGLIPEFLVVLPNGRRPNYDQMRRPMTEICARLHAKRWVNLHSLRHTYATAMLNAGMSLPALKEILGHKSIIMTLVYAKLAQVQLREDCREALGKMTDDYIPTLLMEDATQQSGDAALTSIEQCFDRLRALIRRQLDSCTDAGITPKTELRLRQLESVTNRMAKLKSELLQIVAP